MRDRKPLFRFWNTFRRLPANRRAGYQSGSGIISRTAPRTTTAPVSRTPEVEIDMNEPPMKPGNEFSGASITAPGDEPPGTSTAPVSRTPEVEIQRNEPPQKPGNVFSGDEPPGTTTAPVSSATGTEAERAEQPPCPEQKDSDDSSHVAATIGQVSSVPELSSSGSYKDIQTYAPWNESGTTNATNEAVSSGNKDREKKIDTESEQMKPSDLEHDLDPKMAVETEAIKHDEPLHKDKDVSSQENSSDENAKFKKRITLSDAHSSSIHDKPVNVITLTGDNRGASMETSSDSSKRGKPVFIHRGYKRSLQGITEETRNEKGSSKGGNGEEHPAGAYVNNNAQGINNSILLNVSITEWNPGVRLIISHVPRELLLKLGMEAAGSEKPAHESSVRRRCLRGLLLEASDSDADNTEKPRRHGCRV